VDPCPCPLSHLHQACPGRRLRQDSSLCHRSSKFFKWIIVLAHCHISIRLVQDEGWGKTKVKLCWNRSEVKSGRDRSKVELIRSRPKVKLGQTRMKCEPGKPKLKVGTTQVESQPGLKVNQGRLERSKLGSRSS